MANTKLEEYYPFIYKNVRETDELVNTENEMFDELDAVTAEIKNNQYVQMVNEIGVQIHEAVLGIIANPLEEDLQFRRDRVINRLSLSQAFTLKFLYNKLDEIIGLGKWNAWVDYSNFTLYVESANENQSWYKEILITVHQIKPANMIFIYHPLIIEGIKISEAIDLTQINYNYKIGTTWRLGQTAFTTLDNMGVFKLAGSPSIQSELLNDIATFTAGDIVKVIINDLLEITLFSIKNATNNVVTIEYTVPSAGLSEITNIKLLDSADHVLTSSDVYIPVLEDLILKHNIAVFEGV